MRVIRTPRLRRRLAVWFFLTVMLIGSWDQVDVLPGQRNTSRVTGSSYERFTTATADGYASLGRPRLTEVAAAPWPALSAPVDSAIAPPPVVFGAVSPRVAPPPMLQSRFADVRPTGGTWAVMVGINDYPGTRHDLQSARQDAEEVDTALARLGVPGSNRLLIRDAQATAPTLRRALDWLQAHAAEDAVVVFFYAGHVRKVGDGREALVAADGAVVHDADLASMMSSVRARQGWVAIAACFGGGFTEVLRPGWVLTGAAAAGEVAYENEQLGRSYLVEYMVRRAMIEHGEVTVEAAFAWAHAALSREHPDRVPVQFDHGPRDIDLRSPPPSQAPPPPPAPAGDSPQPAASPPPSDSQPTPSEPPPPRGGSCGQLTGGIVRCGS